LSAFLLLRRLAGLAFLFSTGVLLQLLVNPVLSIPALVFRGGSAHVCWGCVEGVLTLNVQNSGMHTLAQLVANVDSLHVCLSTNATPLLWNGLQFFFGYLWKQSSQRVRSQDISDRGRQATVQQARARSFRVVRSRKVRKTPLYRCCPLFGTVVICSLAPH
jgi:hypothetical protein